MLSFVVVGCGSRVTLDEDASTDGAAPTDSVVVTDTATDTSASDTSPIDAGNPDDACKPLEDAICGNAAKCCMASGLTWDEAKCRSAISSYCGYLVVAVGEGLATYDGSKLTACTSGWSKNILGCQVDFLTYLTNYAPCFHLFNGVHEPGSTCNPKGIDSLACKAADGFLASCDQTEGKCRAYGIVSEGSPCNYTGSTIRYCDHGFYCDIADPMPTCKKAKALGDTCTGPDDYSCGLFNVCKDGKCAAGLPGGAACTDGSECASYTCTMGQCTSEKQQAVDNGVCNGG
jgi:hypothetical protein